MEASSVLSPIGCAVNHELILKHPHPPEPSEPCIPSTPEPNFRIDDLLDFSNGELFVEFDDEEQEELKEGNLSCDQVNMEVKLNRCMASEKSQQQPTTSGLCVPAPWEKLKCFKKLKLSDDLADQLEWLSAFHEDSSYSGDRTLASLVSSGCLGGLKDDEKPASHLDNMFQSASPNSVLELNNGYHAGAYHHVSSTSCGSSQHVPSRARSKRGRSAPRMWSLDSIMPTLFDTRHAGAAAQESPIFFGLTRDSMEPPVRAKKVKRPSILSKPITEAPARRCSHCLVTKTPQWRAGPMGPKTLCNACGVRYKSGRLLPEYRPAGSPTFVSEVHSNSHKRILEMRRMKEMEEHMDLHKDEEEGESDCVSQSESCKELRSLYANPPDDYSQEDLDGSTCSGKDDATDSICSEKEDPAGIICVENGSAIGGGSCSLSSASSVVAN